MKATRQDEYATLREELLQHQERRLPILGVMLPVVVGLCGTAIELENPYLAMGALLLLFSARIQLAETQYGIQRIASYLRIMHEENNNALNWETGSYTIRKTSMEKRSPLWRIVPFSPLDALLLVTGLAASAISIGLAFNQTIVSRYTCSAAAGVWLVLWILYGLRTRALASMRADQIEEAFWRDYKRTLLKRINGRQETTGASISISASDAADYGKPTAITSDGSESWAGSSLSTDR